MPLNKAQLKNRIKTISENLFNNTGNLTAAQSREVFATDMADAMDEFVKTAMITYTGGLAVPGVGVVVGSFGNTIS